MSEQRYALTEENRRILGKVPERWGCMDLLPEEGNRLVARFELLRHEGGASPCLPFPS